VVRYPLVEHERYQADSYFIHFLSQAIVDDGYAQWAFHPLSYFGYYPLSYPMAVPFLLAELSELTGLSIEVSILVANICFAAVFCIGVFVLARQFMQRPEYALLVTLFAILGARFVDTSYWDGSARGPIAVLIMLTVFAFLRAASTGQNRLFIVGILFGFACFATHHMAVLLVLFGLGYALAAFQIHYLFVKFKRERRKLAIAFNSMVAIMIAVVAFGFFDFFGELAEANLQKTSLFDINPPAVSILLNAAVSYANQIGFILPFAFLGIYTLLRRSRLTTEQLLPLTILFCFIPMLGNSIYVSMILSPLICVLGTMWLAELPQNERRRAFAFTVVVLLVASSIALPLWSTQRWNSREYPGGDTVEVGNQVFNDAVYLSNQDKGESAICNTYVLYMRLAATSEVNFLASGAPLILNGDVSPKEVNENVTWSESPFPVNIYEWFVYPGQPNVNIYVLVLIVGGIESITGQGIYASAREYFSSHTKLVVVLDNNHPSSFIGMWDDYPSKLPSEIREGSFVAHQHSGSGSLELRSYSTYQSERVSTYLVQLPI